MENRKSKYVFIVLSVFCVMMIVLSSVKDGLMNPIRNTIGYVLVPLQEGVNRVGFGIYDQLRERKSLKEQEEQNKSLQEKIDVLTEENNVLKQNSEELKKLRELYSLDQNYLQYHKVAARVIAKDSENWFQVFRIDKGSRDGIRVDQNVMANGGLVGIVTDVGLNYATVRSIIDDESRVSCMGIQTSDNCIVAGDLKLYEEGRLRITNMKKDAVIQDGDRIVTSNISSKFMPGILVGYAIGIEEDEKRLMKNGYLIPAADFNDLSAVLVITDVKSDQFQTKDSSGAEPAALSETNPESSAGSSAAEGENVPVVEAGSLPESSSSEGSETSSGESAESSAPQ